MRRKSPKVGEVKTVRKFLFLPVTVDEEMRWLELATVRYKFVEDVYGIMRYWRAEAFVDDD